MAVSRTLFIFFLIYHTNSGLTLAGVKFCREEGTNIIGEAGTYTYHGQLEGGEDACAAKCEDISECGVYAYTISRGSCYTWSTSAEYSIKQDVQYNSGFKRGVHLRCPEFCREEGTNVITGLPISEYKYYEQVDDEDACAAKCAEPYTRYAPHDDDLRHECAMYAYTISESSCYTWEASRVDDTRTVKDVKYNSGFKRGVHHRCPGNKCYFTTSWIQIEGDIDGITTDNLIAVPVVHTPEECQSECVKIQECSWWSYEWYEWSNGQGPKIYHGCALFKGAEKPEEWSGDDKAATSGPRNC